MNYTKGELRKEITRIVKAHTLCADGEALGASGNIIELPLIKAAPAMYEALKTISAFYSDTGYKTVFPSMVEAVRKVNRALAKAEEKDE